MFILFDNLDNSYKVIILIGSWINYQFCIYKIGFEGCKGTFLFYFNHQLIDVPICQ